jgi:REP element-mobilizing transposase RayT
MRRARLKGEPEAEAAYYHCISRVVDRRFILDAPQKEAFVRFMRGYETYCGVQIITFCVMSNHFHVLLRVPKRPSADLLPSDAELVERLRAADCSYGAQTLAQQLENLRTSGRHQDAETLRERFFSTMWDVSYFMRVLKQRFSQWYNGRHDRKGTLWEERFRSVLVEAGSTLRTVALYIDLNPVRAGMVNDPKDYRWCGYAEATAGARRAREAIARAMDGCCSGKASIGRRLVAYRLALFEAGGIFVQQDGDEKIRNGSAAQLFESVRLSHGKLGLREVLRCRVRYFTEGLVLGSVEFVEHHFQRYRSRFSGFRLRGARPVGGMAMLDLHSLVN